jgi:elongation factor G
MRKIAAQYKEVLMEAIAETSEEMLNKYFDGEEITREEAVEAIHNGIIDGSIVPVFCGSAVNLWGVMTLLDAINESFPRHTAKKNEKLADGTLTPIKADGETSIFIFKTIADPFVGKMSLFKVMNGSLKRDMTLNNLRSGTQEKIAKIFTLKGKNQTEAEELPAVTSECSQS